MLFDILFSSPTAPVSVKGSVVVSKHLSGYCFSAILWYGAVQEDVVLSY